MGEKIKISVVVCAVILVAVLIGVFAVGCTGKYNYYAKFSGKKYSEGSDRFFNGYGTYNNGVAKSGAEMERLTSVTPSEKQLNYLELEYYNFIHFGMNTFTGEEWGTGKESPSQFNPTSLSTDQWCEALQASGSKGIILTAKHHDGFCLWQTDSTEHSIKNSPYKDGKGDVVKELSESCARYGLKFGVYLSPWDMNAKSYGHTSKCNHDKGDYNSYDDLFEKQLRELLDGRYGEIFSVWFDGARGNSAVVDSDFEYDFDRYYRIVKELQPNAVTCVQGEDVRWVGNEAGVSRESEWSVISKGDSASQDFQQNANDGKKLQSVKFDDKDVGSRELLSKYKDLIFKPSEVDVSIRQGWFYHSNQKPKTLEHLLKIYYKSVGGNSSLLLNVPPDTRGLIDDADVSRLREFGSAISDSVKNKRTPSSVTIGDAYDRKVKDVSGMLTDDRYTNYTFTETEYIVDFKFDQSFKLSRFDIREDMRYSHRIELFDIYAKVNNKWVLLTEATNVGNRRTLMFDTSGKFPSSDTYRLVIKQSRLNPVIRSVQFYA